MQDITAAGAHLVALSPQRAELNAEMKQKHRLEFPILADADNGFARSLGLVHELPDDLVAVYRGFGVDLPAAHGVDRWELPLATRLVVGRDGVIVAIDADPDYTVRPEPDETLAVLRGLAG